VKSVCAEAEGKAKEARSRQKSGMPPRLPQSCNWDVNHSVFDMSRFQYIRFLGRRKSCPGIIGILVTEFT
jgi:hypothetical protein